jgi:hypothetical protein
MPSSHSPDTLVVGFDDDRAVANTGLLLPATLAHRLGIEAAVDQLVNLGDRPGHHGQAARCSRCCTPWLPGRTASTTPTCCAPDPPARCSTPGSAPAGRRPAVAPNGLVNELAGRVRRAGATGQPTMRADSGFWSAKVIRACKRHRIRFSVTVRQTSTVTAAIAAIPEHAWTDIDYPDGGIAQVAEATLGSDRLVVRRSRLKSDQGQRIWTGWAILACNLDTPRHPYHVTKPGPAAPAHQHASLAGRLIPPVYPGQVTSLKVGSQRLRTLSGEPGAIRQSRPNNRCAARLAHRAERRRAGCPRPGSAFEAPRPFSADDV